MLMVSFMDIMHAINFGQVKEIYNTTNSTLEIEKALLEKFNEY